MENNDRPQRRATGPASSSSRQYANGTRPITPNQGAYHGPQGTGGRGVGMAGGGSRRRGRGPAMGRGARAMGGYPLRSRPIRFQPNGRSAMRGPSRTWVLGLLALAIVALVVVGVSSCVRGCSDERAKADANPVDARVAAGVDEGLTGRLAAGLDEADALDAIAAQADRYEDQALLELALRVPEARAFVRAYPDAAHQAQPFAYDVQKGTAPSLWCWDANWGNVDYAGHALAVSGSGPVCLSVARMGLTGLVDATPDQIAAQATQAGLATGDALLDPAFLEQSAAGLGLAHKEWPATAENVTSVLDAGTYLMVQVRPGDFGEAAHWVLLVTENEDGSVVVHDPTSPQASAHPWDPATIASECVGALHALSLPEADDAGGANATKPAQ